MTLPTNVQIKNFIAKAIVGPSIDGFVDDVDTVFHADKEDGELAFLGTTEDGTEFEVTLTIQDIVEVSS